MEKFEYDDNCPWHANANLLFGFICQYCDAEIYFDDVVGCNPDDDFGVACAQVTNEAKKQGWKIIEEFSFCCPKCSKVKGL